MFSEKPWLRAAHLNPPPSISRKHQRAGNGTHEVPPISEYFGELTFGLGQMREKLSKLERRLPWSLKIGQSKREPLTFAIGFSP